MFKIPLADTFLLPSVADVGIVTGDAHHPAFLVEVGIEVRLRRHGFIPFCFPSNSTLQRLLRRGKPISVPVFTGDLRLFIQWEYMIEKQMINR